MRDDPTMRRVNAPRAQSSDVDMIPRLAIEPFDTSYSFKNRAYAALKNVIVSMDIYRSRTEIPKPGISAKVGSRTLRLDIDRAWLAGNPLTVTALEEEMQDWEVTGYKLDVRTLRDLEEGGESQQAA